MINKLLVPGVVLPCPNQIDVRNRNNWHFALNAPVAQPPQENPPQAANLDAMHAAILRQDQRFLAMEQSQAETLHLIREMQREQREYAFQNDRNFEALSAHIADALHLNDSDSDRRRRPRTRGRGARGRNHPSNE